MPRKASNRPTKSQRQVLNFIDNFISGHGYGPSYREIMRGMGYSSVATVALHVDNLIAKGYLRKKDNSARSLEVIGSEEDFKTNQVKAKDEKWLVDLISNKFNLIESLDKPKQTDIDQLYVLVGALKVLELESAANSFMPRLSKLKKKL